MAAENFKVKKGLEVGTAITATSSGVNVTGVVTATTFVGNGDFVDIDVDGTAELDNVNVTGSLDVFNVRRASQTNTKITFGDSIINLNTGVSPKLTLNGDNVGIGSQTPQAKLDVNGNTELDDLNVAGVSTFTGAIDANGNLDVDGQTDLDDVVVAGVSTFNDGITLGTNSTTFDAKFADDAVANFGTDNDLQVSHDNSNALIRNSTGKIVVVGVVSATSGANITGVVTATTFSGSGASLTNLPSSQLSGALPALDGSALTGVTASGSGIVVKHDGTTVGTAGTINFSTNLDVTAV